MVKERVLFVCVHNAARSQMAEAFLREMAPARFDVESAGIEPGKLNPIVVEAMLEIGIDISKKSTKSVADLAAKGLSYDIVITVCDEAQAARCPFVPGKGERMQWGFDDPAGFGGSHDEVLAKVRKTRDAIKKKIGEWLRRRDEGEKGLFTANSGTKGK